MVKYIRISQMLLDFKNVQLRLPDMILLAEETNMLNKIHLSHDEMPKLLWGTGIYEVQEDNSLKLIKSNFDTSG